MKTSGDPRSSTSLSEVVVTARQREETLQNVPIAVSAIGGELLDSSNSVNTQQLAQLVPSLYFNSANPRNTAYTIRGLGSNTLSVSAANDGIEPGVGFYVDGVYHGRPATAAFDFTDIERIEVLRGPQGTLFGKNTTGGAINIISRAPTFAPEASAQLSFGNYDFMQAKTSFSGGLTDRLAGRVAAQITRRDGLITQVNTDRKLNDQNNVALRGQLLFQAKDDLALRLIADVRTSRQIAAPRASSGWARACAVRHGSLQACLPHYPPMGSRPTCLQAPIFSTA
jgi:iron complex outermembrane receptor protein